MRTVFQVLSDNERAQVHERTLKILANTGVHVQTAKGRRLLERAGAQVDEDNEIVRFQRSLVEEALRLAPKRFSLGARRSGWDLEMNAGQCHLIGDGEAVSVLDRKTGEYRPTTLEDWREATLLTDALDDFGAYWAMAEPGGVGDSMADLVEHWKRMFGNFSKHVQDASSTAAEAPWLLEVLQTIFGDKETIRREHPYSFLICPRSPLTIEEQHTDAYLELAGWHVPVPIRPLPSMGGTGPCNIVSMAVLGNSEVLAMLCLVQAAEPGTPFIYAPVLAAMNPHTGLYSAGAIENGLLSSAAIEMARYYGLPAEGTGGGTDTYVPGIQTGYERSLNSLMPMLSWPDFLVGAGLLGGSMILSLEQLVIDTEIFRMNKQARRGIPTDDDMWLDDIIERVGPTGHYLAEKSTAESIRAGEWLISRIGVHRTREDWEASGKKDVVEEAREKVEEILSKHEPLPFGEDVEKGLASIRESARKHGG